MGRNQEVSFSESPQMSYVMINCEPGSEQQVIDQLKSIEEIEEIQGVVGTYDIVAKIRTPSIEMLREIIILKIRKIQQIRATTTVMCLKETPNSHDLR